MTLKLNLIKSNKRIQDVRLKLKSIFFFFAETGFILGMINVWLLGTASLNFIRCAVFSF